MHWMRWFGTLQYALRMEETIRFISKGKVVEERPEATLTVLDYLRENAHRTGTKEGCGEGDCGACTVGIARLNDQGQVQYSSTNSCIRFLSSLDGAAIITVEDLAQTHPAQKAMVACHASQCGFCTPGFVMSLAIAHELNHGQALSRDQVGDAISGNLCRCTGYKPIVDAGMTMNWHALELPNAQPYWWRSEQLLPNLRAITRSKALIDLLFLRSQNPGAQVIAGSTDVGLWVTKQHKYFSQSLDVTQVNELREIDSRPEQLSIGCAVPLAQAFEALAQWSAQAYANNSATVAGFAHRFAGKPIRSTGTLGGNVANGSPIGDSMPLLLAMGASVRLQSIDSQHELALEDFYLGYRKTALAEDEILTHILVPAQELGARLFAHKVSKRFEDDISAVCLVARLTIVDRRIVDVRLGVGGMAATPMRAYATEQALKGELAELDTFLQVRSVLHSEFTPLSDMRASADYRRAVLCNLLLKVFHQLDGLQVTSVFELSP
jgi:xanthine dehydrogenase small subunit